MPFNSTNSFARVGSVPAFSRFQYQSRGSPRSGLRYPSPGSSKLRRVSLKYRVKGSAASNPAQIRSSFLPDVFRSFSHSGSLPRAAGLGGSIRFAISR